MSVKDAYLDWITAGRPGATLDGDEWAAFNAGHEAGHEDLDKLIAKALREYGIAQPRPCLNYGYCSDCGKYHGQA